MTTPKPGRKVNLKEATPISEEVWALIEESIGQIRNGAITLVVQDSRVIQMNKNEKIRFV